MADDRKEGISTNVVVALLALLGVLGGAAINNWDKLFGHPAAAAWAAHPAATDGGPAPVAPAVRPAIGGRWHDQYGGSFDFTVAGANVTFSGNADVKRMTGVGQLDGATFTSTISNNQDDGTTSCKGLVVSAALIEATCTEPGNPPFAWRLER